MEKKGIGKCTKKLYDTPEETTNTVLDFVVEMEASALDGASSARVNQHDHQAARQMAEPIRGYGGSVEGSDGSVAFWDDASTGQTMSPCYRRMSRVHRLPSVIAAPPGTPVEIFSYG
ncbi:hypothetical protein DRE_06262 [Drechslerella stenobrocha 248]|uniref:Uncharacterized protein n=1 Tax=Drechslerella stenobrocha 248 TaxID=1043628 RepID=W7HYV5_9PEZI|nr:hypothetical protein DRE_06262 [Drechslerella stenobrocha 248]